MKIATWNVNSIRSRVERVAAWTARERPDVLCMQELKTTDDGFPLEPFADLGYHAEVFGQKTYNGVAILALSPLTQVVRNLPDDEPEAPRRLLAATAGKLRIVNVYVPNGQSPTSDKFVYKLDWLSRLEKFLETAAKPKDPLILLGDFNIAPEERDVRYIDLWRGGIHFHPKEHEALGKITSWGLHDLLRKHHEEGGLYSWWDYRQLAFQKNNGLRIDLILGTKPVFDRCTGVEIFRDERKGESPSDHVPVVAEIAD
ncbi:MAG TPA: exodeoxyribonuclease III [Thermoanaerobaculia bacterium]|nr:exodeoxyribonuclease III [Thermoanaerobaculia bacterium]